MDLPNSMFDVIKKDLEVLEKELLETCAQVLGRSI